MRELITIQVGQCGNQVSHEFWKNLQIEHGLTENGEVASHLNLESLEDHTIDRKEIFFNQFEDQRYIPRAILLDLEPRVLNSISSNGKFYNLEAIFKCSAGGGAGNNWGKGYMKGKEYCEPILDMISKEAESCDNFEGFNMFHSIAGGTGSGTGSYFLENISDIYPKKLIQTISVFPNTSEMSDVVVQPYNSVLTCSKLCEFADAVIIIDNSALTKMVQNCFMTGDPDFTHGNRIIAGSTLGITSPYRFPRYTHETLSSILTTLVNIPKCQFLTLGSIPNLSGCPVGLLKNFIELKSLLPRSTLYENIRKLYSTKNQLISFESERELLSSICFIRSNDIDPVEVFRASRKIMQSNILKFPSWAHSKLQIIQSITSPYALYDHKSRFIVTSLSNSIKVVDLFQKVLSQYDRLRKRGAFLDQYKKLNLFSDDLTEFDQSRDLVQLVIEKYLDAKPFSI